MKLLRRTGLVPLRAGFYPLMMLTMGIDSTVAVIADTSALTTLTAHSHTNHRDFSMKMMHTLATLLIAAGLLTACAKEEPQTTTEKVKEAATAVKEDAAETLEDASDAMKEAADDVGDAAAEMKEDAAEAMEDTGEAISEGADDAADALKDAAETTEEKVKEVTN